MRILIFSLVYYPRFVGGAEVAVKEVTDRISKEEILFDMITLRTSGEKKEETIGSVHVFRVGPMFVPFWFRKYLFPFVAWFKARQLHAQNAYHATWSIMANYAGFSALFFKLSHKKIPFILTLQEGDSLAHIRHRVGIMYPLFKRIFTKADRIQAISSFLAEWATYMGAKAPIRVIPNGVNTHKFKVQTRPNVPGSVRYGQDEKFKVEEKEEIRNTLGIRKEDKVVITTSRLVKKNGIGDLVESLVYLPLNVKLLVVGSGTLEQSLKFKVKSLKLEDRVTFVGYVDHSELPQYLHASDIFCRPSLSEGLGISFLEAMASDIPVVATPVGGIPDFLCAPLPTTPLPKPFSQSQEFENSWKGRITGLFCKEGDPKSIADAILALLSDELLRARTVANASKMVQEKYEWGNIAEKMKAVFESASS